MSEVQNFPVEMPLDSTTGGGGDPDPTSHANGSFQNATHKTVLHTPGQQIDEGLGAG